MLGLPCYVLALFSCSERWLLSSHGIQASHRGGFSCGSQALECRLSCPGECGILSDQGLNLPCIGWELNCQGIPPLFFGFHWVWPMAVTGRRAEDSIREISG